MIINKFAAASDRQGFCWYRQLAAADVAPEMVHIVGRVFVLLAAELSIGPSSLQIKWAEYADARVVQAERGENSQEQEAEPFKTDSFALLPCTFGGLVPNLSTSIIVLNAVLPSAAHLVNAAIEEIFHVHQHRTWPLEQVKDAPRCEESAKDYVERTMPRIMDELVNELW